MSFVTWRLGASPYMPVARTTSLYWPAARVPELIVNVVFVPDPDAGETALDDQPIEPIPVGSVSPGSASTDRLTGAPNDDDPMRLSVNVQVALLPSVAASPSDAADVIEKSRVTVPIWTVNGRYLTVRYGLPASPLSHME